MTDIKPEHIVRFKRYAKQLDKLMKEIVEYCPEANYYAEDSHSLHLMKGESHIENGMRGSTANHEASVEMVLVFGLSGGGW